MTTENPREPTLGEYERWLEAHRPAPESPTDTEALDAIERWCDDHMPQGQVEVVMQLIEAGLVVTRAEHDKNLSEAEEHHLAMHHAFRPEVVAEIAVNLGDHEMWDRLVDWCGGKIDTSQDPSGEYTSTLVLPNGEAGGDGSWLVLDHAGEFHIRTEVAAPELGDYVTRAQAEQREAEAVAWLSSHEASVVVTDALTKRGVFILRPKVREALIEARAHLAAERGREQ